MLKQDEADKNKTDFLGKLAENRSMPITEAIKVLNINEDQTSDLEHIEERYAAMIKMNEECKRKSPYLIAKINNAKDAVVNNIKGILC